MFKLIVSRTLQGIIVLFVVSALTFALLAAAGSDALTAMLDDPLTSEQTLTQLRQIYGLDQPLAVRYGRWLGGVARGDMGRSFYYHAPVAGIVRARLWRTLALAALALAIAWTIALALGAWAARRAGSWVDKLCDACILLAASTPRIVLALAALVFAARASLFVASDGGVAAAERMPAARLRVRCCPRWRSRFHWWRFFSHRRATELARRSAKSSCRWHAPKV